MDKLKLLKSIGMILIFPLVLILFVYIAQNLFQEFTKENLWMFLMIFAIVYLPYVGIFVYGFKEFMECFEDK